MRLAFAEWASEWEGKDFVNNQIFYIYCVWNGVCPINEPWWLNGFWKEGVLGRASMWNMCEGRWRPCHPPSLTWFKMRLIRDLNSRGFSLFLSSLFLNPFSTHTHTSSSSPPPNEPPLEKKKEESEAFFPSFQGDNLSPSVCVFMPSFALYPSLSHAIESHTLSQKYNAIGMCCRRRRHRPHESKAWARRDSKSSRSHNPITTWRPQPFSLWVFVRGSHWWWLKTWQILDTNTQTRGAEERERKPRRDSKEGA